MKHFFLIFILLCFCSIVDDIEKNKRLNFDACDKKCFVNGTMMKRFEQGLGYVTCECNQKCEK